MTTTVEILADSINTDGDRITTMRLRYPRFIHSEFMTHRVFSRNARSSRAVPVKRMIEEVLKDPAMPVRWGANKPGMQDGGALTGWRLGVVKGAWRLASRMAVLAARAANFAGAHKQVVNRILEPFLHIDVIVTATDWGNFYSLRCHEDADPTIRALADEMREKHDASRPDLLHPGEWHIPMCGDGEWELESSVARCARVSYGRSEGRSLESDLKLYDTLEKSGHWSPFEHQAQAMPGEWHRNFRGFKHLRSIVDQKA